MISIHLRVHLRYKHTERSEKFWASRCRLSFDARAVIILSMFSGLFSAYMRRGKRLGIAGLLKAVLNAVKPVKSLESVSDSHVKSDSSADFSNSVGYDSSVVPASSDSRSAIVASSDGFSSVHSGVFNTNTGSTCFFNCSVFVFCDFLRISMKPQDPFDVDRAACQALRSVS